MRWRRWLWAAPGLVWAGYDLYRLAAVPRFRLDSTAGAAGTGRDGVQRMDDFDIVIPARNEAAFVDGCLDALGSGPVTVVDDGSSDATGALARAAGATVVDAGPRPSGWAGKAWALARGTTATRSTWIVYVDADVRVDRRTAASLVDAACAAGVDAAALLGHQHGWLAFDAGLLVIRHACDVRAVNAGRSTYLVGQCFAIRRSALAAAGGWESVLGSTVEDVDMGERLGRHLLLTATDQMAVASRGGFGALRRSWIKNMWRTHGGRRGLIRETCHFLATAILPALGGPLPRLAVHGVVATTRFGARISAGRPVAASTLQAVCWPVCDVMILAVFADSVRGADDGSK